jgi:hypothetical protein
MKENNEDNYIDKVYVDLEDLIEGEIYLMEHSSNPENSILGIYKGRNKVHYNLENIGETSNPVDGAFGFCTYDFKIVMIPYLEHDSWRFSIGSSYSIYEGELNFLKKL